MKVRNEDEIMSYVEGYTQCYKDFTYCLKGRKSVVDAVKKMNVLLTAVQNVVGEADNDE